VTIDVRYFRCRSDNVGLLARNRTTGEAILVDAPDEEPILREMESCGWSPSAVLVTHHHADHVAAIPALKARSGLRVLGPATEAERIPGLDDPLPAESSITLLGEEMVAMGTPGHTRGHLTYHFPASGIVFVGDTLFALGCGRFTECEPAVMLDSLKRLRALPSSTLVYCGHDYFDKNARFALTLDSDNKTLNERAERAARLARDHVLAPPSTIGMEAETNPFLRWNDPRLRSTLDMETAVDHDVLAEIRRRRNAF
jgi:hydroxyacylglutathione hydrolase